MCHCRVIDDFQHRLITKYPSIYISLPNDFNFLRSKCFSMKLSFYSFVKKLISLFAAVQSLLNFSRRNRSDPLAPMFGRFCVCCLPWLPNLPKTSFLPTLTREKRNRKLKCESESELNIKKWRRNSFHFVISTRLLFGLCSTFRDNTAQTRWRHSPPIFVCFLPRLPILPENNCRLF